MPTLLARYLQGQHVEVWNELRAYTSINDDVSREAWPVAIETMQRVARNADRLAGKLAGQGWIPLYGELRTPPAANDAKVIERIEELTGSPVPMSLLAFWHVVGGINFVWNYNCKKEVPALLSELEMDDMDPLCVDSASTTEFLVDEWEDQIEEMEEPYRIGLSPDYAHKINVSGGEPYGIDVPFCGIDPIFDDDRHGLPFVDYLRLCFRYAGFPSLERVPEREDLREFLVEWTRDLEVF